MLTTLFYVVVVLGTLIFIHELGHFIVAKKSNITVEEFGFGYPPRLFTLAEFGETKYTVNLLPFGGFVRMLDEEDPSVPGSFASKGKLARAATLIAGPAMNILLAVILLVVASSSSPAYSYVGGVKVLEVASGSPAEKAGMLRGDVIVEVNGYEVGSYVELQSHLEPNLGEEVNIVVERNGQRQPTMNLVPRENPPAGEGAIGVQLGTQPGVRVTDVRSDSPAAEAGIQPGDVILNFGGEFIRNKQQLKRFVEERPGWQMKVRIAREGRILEPLTLTIPSDPSEGEKTLGLSFRPSLFGAIGGGLRRAGMLLLAIPAGLAELVRGTAPPDSVLGPIGIAQVTGEFAESGLMDLLQFTAVLSVNLALLNMLPFPALDGGRLIFVILEALRGGKRVDPKMERVVHLIGMAVLISLMIVVSFLDVQRLLSGESIIPR